MELPGLIAALNERRGHPLPRLMLGTDGDSQPRRLVVADRTVYLGWFRSLPAGLLTAMWRNGDRVDLLVVPPDVTAAAAAVAMATAAGVANTLRTPDILASLSNRSGTDERAAETVRGREGDPQCHDDALLAE